VGGSAAECGGHGRQGKQHKSSPTLAKCWEELLFATVGEFFEDPDVIGIVVGIKTTEDVLQVWNRDNSGGMGVARKIGNLLKDLLGKHLDHHNTMEYKECSSAVKGCKSPDGTKASPWLAAAAAKCPPHLPPPSPTVSPPGLITPRAPGCFLS